MTVVVTTVDLAMALRLILRISCWVVLFCSSSTIGAALGRGGPPAALMASDDEVAVGGHSTQSPKKMKDEPLYLVSSTVPQHGTVAVHLGAAAEATIRVLVKLSLCKVFNIGYL